MSKIVNRLIIFSILIISLLLYLIYSSNNYIKNSYIINNSTLGYDDIKYSPNEDLVGTINIDNISANIMQGLDNEFYLTHDNNKNDSIFGSIFLDYHSDLLNSQISVIYGHSSNTYNLPFNNLKKYLDPTFLKEHQQFAINYLGQNLNYEIVDAYSASSFKKLSSKGNWLLIQTCDQDNSGNYIIIVSKKVK